MVLQASKTRIPYVGLMCALTITLTAVLWDFFRRAHFTPCALGEVALICLVVMLPHPVLYTIFRRNQSVTLSDEGASVELLFFRDRPGVLPEFRRTLLRWDEVEEVSFQGPEIQLRGGGRIVRINIIYFRDTEQILEMIKHHCPTLISKSGS